MELKKIISSVVLAGIIALAAGFISDILYSPDLNPEIRGYKIAENTNNNIAAGASATAGGTAATAVPEVDFATLLKNADITAGQKISKKCKACHDLTAGAKNKVGPALFGVAGKSIASNASFKYSKAMSAKGGKWTNENLNQFIKKPKAYIKGTKMAFAGIKKPEQRANLIAYLNTLR